MTTQSLPSELHSDPTECVSIVVVCSDWGDEVSDKEIEDLLDFQPGPLDDGPEPESVAADYYDALDALASGKA